MYPALSGQFRARSCLSGTNAEVIITFNLKDFPDDALVRYNLKAIHPDDFISDLIELNIGAALDAMRKHRAGMKNPLFSADEYLDLLLKQRLPETVSKLRPLTLMI